MRNRVQSVAAVRWWLVLAAASSVAVVALGAWQTLLARELSGQRTVLPEVVLAAGLVAAFVLGFAVYEFEKARAWAGRMAQARDELLRAEQRHRLTLEAAPMAIVMVDSTGSIVLVNALTEKLFGYTREELLGQSVEKLIPQQFRQSHPGLRAGFHAAPAARPMGMGRDLYGLRKDGSEFPVEIGLNPVETEEGLFVLSAIVDITGRKRAEAELRTLNDSLEERVTQRTSQLRTMLDALTIAKETAETANRAKSSFLANMSHEIRTPLNAVIGLTELVLGTSLNNDQRRYLNMVRESGESLLKVINDILDFSKIEAGRLDLEHVPFDHAELLGDTMKSLGLRASAKGLELTCRIAPDVPTRLIGDAGRLRQVLVNLVGNAVKFTERGEVAVDVRRESATDDSLTLRYAVRDTGIGIPPDKLKKVFEPFEQGDVSTTRRFGGTGLGLAISSRLVDMMGGRIWAESQEGEGSTFSFTVNLAIPHEPSRETRPLRLESLAGMPVLITDDNAVNRELLQEMLANWGMKPIATENAARALAVLRRATREARPIELLITDAHMPGMDGFELARRIREDEELSATIIMMLSSGDRPDDWTHSDQLGIAVYLTKPIKQSELFDAVVTALDLRPAEPTQAPPTSASPAQPTNARCLRILLAEDSPVNQTLAMALLTKAGHQVDLATNGRQTLQMWQEGEYDLVLMDVQMPEIDGLDATKAIRALERQHGGHTPIIAMTAHALKGDRERCLEAGMDDYVSKPISQHEFFEAVKRVLGADVLPPAPEEPAAEKPRAKRAPSIVNWPTAQATAFGDPQMLKELVETSLHESPRLMEEIRSAIYNDDAAMLNRAAHTLKGHLSVFGAAVPEHLAAHIENTARDGSVDVAEAFARLARQIDRMQVEMRDFLTASKANM